MNNVVIEIDLSKQKQDKKLRYMYIYDPSHPMASKSGKLYVHRYIMAKHLGRYLRSEEVIHHIDHDKTNNDINNLELCTNSVHAQKHMLERNPESILKDFSCEECGKLVQRFQKRNKRLFCSVECTINSRKVHKVIDSCGTVSKKRFDPTKEELQDLIWKLSTVKIAALYGVSDKAVEKRCKKLNIDKPPRGYWAKQYANKES